MTIKNEFTARNYSDFFQYTHLPEKAFSEMRNSSWRVLSVLLMTMMFLLWNTGTLQQDYIQQEFIAAKSSVEDREREIH